MNTVGKLSLCAALLAVTGAVGAQVGSTVKEGAKATSETAMQVGDETKAAVESEPKKSIDKAKAKVHKVKARHHAKKAKEAAKNIPK